MSNTHAYVYIYMSPSLSSFVVEEEWIGSIVLCLCVYVRVCVARY